MSDKLPDNLNRVNVLTRSIKDIITNDGEDKPEMDWVMTPDEWQTVSAIGRRAHQMGQEHGVELSIVLVCMDVATVHCHITPLNLFQLLTSSDDDFHHDVIRGMGQFLDRPNRRMIDGYELRSRKVVS